ncbi:hypothetical protein [Alcanivorax sp.]|uniref:hypothetical protein n=1 Tax=Alcanivorax sp. TaxID=1872427 RepID=UPI000C118C7D|nr:hypothetical protein [Alcanivorax sp.]PHR66343.1 MAG: hypothetical protein COA55_10045 [Alcanivorax sp.]
MEVIEELVSISKQLQIDGANEAETRLKVIDKVLFDVLKWTHEDVNVEERVLEDGSATFSDYVIRTANVAFVVEAKKVGIPFESSPKSRWLKLSTTNLKGALGEAVTQARDYCRKLGIQFAVVTNGEQWVVFPANRIDQVAFNESSAIVFNSLKSALVDDYSDFYGLLSREAVVNSSLDNSLLHYTEDQVEERRLRNFQRSGFSAENKNPIYPLIEEAVTLAFSDTITEMDPALFEKCYVNTADRVKFDRKINMHLSKSQKIFNKTPVRPLSGKKKGDFKNVLLKAQKKSKPLAIVILGTVGAGKTTFQHYTRNVSSRDIFEKEIDGFHPQWLRVDFLKYTEDCSPAEFIYESLMDMIVDSEELCDQGNCVDLAYEKDIKALRMTTKRGDNAENLFNNAVSDLLVSDYKKKKPYVKKILSYVGGRVPVYLVVDNVDQLSEEVQSRIFSESISLADKLGVNIVISIRSSTYVKHRNSSSFNAFDFDPILIEPPKVESVISKRFFLARNIVEGDKGDFTAENGSHVIVDDLAVLVELVQSSVLGTEVGNLLDVLAAGDIRNALRMTRHFLEHGYSNSGKAYSIYKQTGAYVLPKHEALRAILLGSHAVYSEDFSLIGNPFDSRLGRVNLQMTRLFVVVN